MELIWVDILFCFEFLILVEVWFNVLMIGVFVVVDFGCNDLFECGLRVEVVWFDILCVDWFLVVVVFWLDVLVLVL